GPTLDDLAAGPPAAAAPPLSVPPPAVDLSLALLKLSGREGVNPRARTTAVDPSSPSDSVSPGPKPAAWTGPIRPITSRLHLSIQTRADGGGDAGEAGDGGVAAVAERGQLAAGGGGLLGAAG